jgi:hypothetical protein
MSRTTRKIRNPERKPKHLPIRLTKVALPPGRNLEKPQRLEKREIKRAGQRVMRRRLNRLTTADE